MNDWAIRTVSRARIIDYLLVRHFGWTHGGTDADEARTEVDAALARWIALGLPWAGGSVDEALFDPVEVMNFMVDAGLRGADPFWEAHHVATERGHFLAQQGLPPSAADVPDIRALPPRSFMVGFEREFALAGFAAGTRLRLRLPVPIEDHATRRLSVKWQVPEGASARLEPARLDVALVLDQPGPLRLGYTATFEAHVDDGTACELSAAKGALYTQLREQLIRVDETVARAARTATAGMGDDHARAQALFDAVLLYFRIGLVPYHAIDPADPYGWSRQNGVLDCQLASALLCAMARSLGMPARIVGGNYLFPGDLSVHFWAEIWLEGRGWTGFDVAGWLLSRGGRDAGWSKLLAGTLDYRIKTQVLPALFTGPGSLRLPLAWHMLARRSDATFETIFLDAQSGGEVYRDRLELLPA